MVSRQRLIDALFVSILIWYAIAGMTLAPFHGDETTIVYMSRDWATIAQGNLSALRYQSTYSDDQQLRLVNGVISTYTFGLSWSAIGLKASDLPTAWWWWGADWKTNADQGHFPSVVVLFSTRLASTFMMVLSIALIFAIAKRLSQSAKNWLPHLIAFIYATTPALLLDGRRAMFEGAAMFTTALVILAALNVARLLRLRSANSRLLNGWLLFGLACGFAIAAKFTTLVVVIAATGMLIFVGGRRSLNIVSAVSSIVGTVLVFLLLNPAWWNAPVQAFEETIRDRQSIITAQVSQFGAYPSLSSRVAGLTEMPLSAPQYYEDNRGWPEWIGSQITTYEDSQTAGVFWGPFGVALWILAFIGLIGLRRIPSAERLVLLGIILFTAASIVVLDPLPWQRYYLPMVALLAILIGLGIQDCVLLRSRLKQTQLINISEKTSV